MKVTLDTNVLLSATLWQGSEAQKLLFTLIRAEAEIFTSNEILLEYQEILARDFGYVEKEIEGISDVLASILTVVNPTRKVVVVKDDPGDNKVIECALESGSQYIITYDKHLLKLAEFEKVKIVKPSELGLAN
ncbi:MAG: putative toxin-antitoxin system toxin component, PIN family [Candidatus Woesearchaeota archaeon]